MKFNKCLVVVDYDSETLEVHYLEDEGEVYEYFDVEVGDKIIKDKKYKGAFEEAILLEVDVDSYFKGGEMSKKQEMIGKIFPTNNGGDCVVVDYINCKNITVRFLDGNNYQVKCQIKELNKGTIKNPYYPTVYGVGYLGEGVHIKTVKRKATKVYDIWKAMLARCYCNIFQQKQKTYLGCSVCDEWYNFQVFAEWYVNHEFYGLGYDLDKDILSKGNKIYSPDTCCLVPSEVNRVIVEKDRKGRVLPTGIWKRGDSGAYTSKVMGEDGSVKSLGVFRSADSALIAYKAARENRVKQVAEKWKGKIKPNVYDALMNWTVE